MFPTVRNLFRNLKRQMDTAIKLYNLTPQALLIVLDRFGWLTTPYYVTLRTNSARIKLRPRKGDYYSLLEHYVWNIYEEGPRLQSGDTVVDVGGNIGVFALTARFPIGDQGKVVVAEPEYGCYQTLIENISINRFGNNMKAYQIALSESENAVRLIVCDGFNMRSSMYGKVDGRVHKGPVQKVRAAKLATLFELGCVGFCNLLKLDCEGAEYAIVRSLHKTMASRIGRIIVETHDVEGESVFEMVQILESFGFRVISHRDAYYFLSRIDD